MELLNKMDKLLKSIKNKEKYGESYKLQSGETIISKDEQTLKELEKYVIDNINKPNLVISDLSKHLHISDRQLRSFMERTISLTPNAFIREIRLQTAFVFLENKKFSTVSEVCYNIGIDSPAYFSRKFKERYNIKPKDLLNK